MAEAYSFSSLKLQEMWEKGSWFSSLSISISHNFVKTVCFISVGSLTGPFKMVINLFQASQGHALIFYKMLHIMKTFFWLGRKLLLEVSMKIFPLDSVSQDWVIANRWSFWNYCWQSNHFSCERAYQCLSK